MFLMLILTALFHGEKTANIAAFQALLILLSAVEAPIKSAYQIYLNQCQRRSMEKVYS